VINNSTQGARTVREVRHPEGKVEAWLADGSRVIAFANGTSKVVKGNGESEVWFGNGDVKRTKVAPPAVEYFYAEVDTWHVTWQDTGVEVYYFPSGQTEAHHQSGQREVLFPTGEVARVMADGLEVELTWDQLSVEIRQPRPTKSPPPKISSNANSGEL